MVEDQKGFSFDDSAHNEHEIEEKRDKETPELTNTQNALQNRRGSRPAQSHIERGHQLLLQISAEKDRTSVA